jgi:geranylgeranyl diphosphate synthase type II
MKTVLSYQEILEDKIKSLQLPDTPKNLYDPLRYFMTLGGKRTRPTLTLMGCQLFGSPGIKALNAALAVELFHNFTLIHDDIMDEAPLRRGKATVHHKWNTNIGILSGDVLFVEAYKFLAKNDISVLPSLIEVFSRTAVEVCEGQQMDMDFETRDDVQIEEYIEMIRLKTSVLLGAALEMGAIVAEAPEKDKKHLYNFGMNIGIAFQLQDDYLDLYADPDKFGKQVGGDIITNKQTFLLLKAKELANPSQSDDLNAILHESNKGIKVESARKLFSEIGVDLLAKDLMYEYYNKAKEDIAAIDVPEESKNDLIALGEYLINRDI